MLLLTRELPSKPAAVVVQFVLAENPCPAALSGWPLSTISSAAMAKATDAALDRRRTRAAGEGGVTVYVPAAVGAAAEQTPLALLQ